MADSHNDGGPAFPIHPDMPCPPGRGIPPIGMSLRAYFAAHAPIEITELSGTQEEGRKALGMRDDECYDYSIHPSKLVAMQAVRYADDLIAELSKPPRGA